MKAQEFRAMTHEELVRKVDDLYQELFNLRFQIAARQLSNTSRLGQVRRDIARARTILTELEQRTEA